MAHKPIKKLCDKLINMIAAGEVVERPMSVIKELAENSLDASATSIEIHIENGGKNLISIADNGDGIAKDQVDLAFCRHATSKIDDDIFAINSFGFRGEALPSIASISNVLVESSNCGQQYSVDFKYGKIGQIAPNSRVSGTKITVTDLFANTPVRMKFMKSNRSEIMACVNLIKRLALANHNVAFKFFVDNALQIEYFAQEDTSLRIAEVLGQEFIENSIPINFKNSRIQFHGRVGFPTYNTGTANNIYNFVNGRTLRDKLLTQTVRNSYVNLVPNGRYPQAVLFFQLDNNEVDVNAHPTKQEVRLVDEKFFKNTVQTAIRTELKQNIHESNTQTSNNFNQSFSAPIRQSKSSTSNNRSFNNSLNDRQKQYDFTQKVHNTPIVENYKLEIAANQPLGVAKCQIANSFIVAENGEELIIVDQHAAHERINLEKFKKLINTSKAQTLAIPKIINFEPHDIDVLLTYKPIFAKHGIVYARQGANAIAIRQINHLIDAEATADILHTLANDEHQDEQILEDKLIYILGNIACKKSIKAGKKLSFEEMDALLRAIESTEHSASCNHGRPTYIKLSKSKLANLFERS